VSRFVEVDYAQLCKAGQRIPGDVFLLSRNEAGNQIVCTLSDGLGSGVKANVLASLTANMAQKLSFSPINILRSASIIMDTLPVCKERRISYSTFTIVNVSVPPEGDILARIVEYDNPPFFLYQEGESRSVPRERLGLKRPDLKREESLSYSDVRLSFGDRIIICTDGVTQAGLGSQAFPLGWKSQALSEFIRSLLLKNPEISARELSLLVVRKAYALDGFAAKDDITCAVISVRNPRRLLVVSGPPVDREKDSRLAARVDAFKGPKIIAGGTTAQILARATGRPIRMNYGERDPFVPPSSCMEGVDLITEGMLTLNAVTKILGQKFHEAEIPQNAAGKIVNLLLSSDRIHFLVGTKINDANQDASPGDDIGTRQSLIRKIARCLETNYLKEVIIEYL
jgi:hypothetical protein